MNVLKHGMTAVALAAAALSGCKKEPAPPPPVVQTPIAPAVSSLALGSAIGAGKLVTASKDAFGVRDTIYVSVATTGTGQNAKLKAVWTFGAETVKADSLTLNLDGPAVSEFHITRPRAWPAGAYKVSVSVNDGGTLTRDFTVR
jgi:hypothetical protein